MGGLFRRSKQCAFPFLSVRTEFGMLSWHACTMVYLSLLCMTALSSRYMSLQTTGQLVLKEARKQKSHARHTGRAAAYSFRRPAIADNQAAARQQVERQTAA